MKLIKIKKENFINSFSQESFAKEIERPKAKSPEIWGKIV